uniref:LOW QUALITY PROTEIN: major histocompatibility complex class I-related gene protein-like n=1 Tax=Monopterus albus TaxID=43700 RepID=UPI0009B45873|nr:LOW QUALITY PROTEIN: major histocompatibility complex class I-related gene protein-like [Monopterus albus]
MKTLIFLALLGTSLHTATAVKHSLTYFLTASSGIPNFPEFVGVAVVDDIVIGYCDGNTIKPRQDWVTKLSHDDPQHFHESTQQCSEILPNIYKSKLDILKQRFNQSGDVHVLQRMVGCEWDEETGEISGFNQYGYNGEDFLAFDLKMQTYNGEDFLAFDPKTQIWITSKYQAVITKLKWEADKNRIKLYKMYLTGIYPIWLKMYVDYGKSSLLRTVLPSVSLLQKTPSSPVSCPATGFYPNRVDMFWRKDGEELHEDVDHGEILPNNDGTFQMSVDLDISSVKPEDWSRYDCVFQLSGVKENIVTKLDKAVIRTNWGKTGIRGGESKKHL